MPVHGDYGTPIRAPGTTRDPRRKDPLAQLTEAQAAIDRLQRKDRDRGSIEATMLLHLRDRGGDPSPPSEGCLIYNKGGATYVISSAGTITMIAPL